ncbi:MAG: LpxI family protein [Myxococcaceae bacterium]
MAVIGLIAGNGTLPRLFARAARAKGLSVVVVAHQGETEPSLADEVDALSWVRVGQLARIQRILLKAGVQEAALAGGFRRMRAVAELRPDFGLVRVLARLRSIRDDVFLRAVAEDFEAHGIRIVSPASYLQELLAPAGRLAGPELDGRMGRDVALGSEVAAALGRADVGQTVVVKDGHVLAVEAVEGTDACIRRGAALGGQGVVVVKRLKPGQDERFDLPAVGPRTLDVMAEVGAAVLAVEAGKTFLLEAEQLVAAAERAHIAVIAV